MPSIPFCAVEQHQAGYANDLQCMCRFANGDDAEIRQLVQAVRNLGRSTRRRVDDENGGVARHGGESIRHGRERASGNPSLIISPDAIRDFLCLPG